MPDYNIMLNQGNNYEIEEIFDLFGWNRAFVFKRMR
jgi:hypothetical protein